MAEAQKDSDRRGVASFKGGTETPGASEQVQVVVTINRPMGKIVKVERIDYAGKRQELSDEDWGKLIRDDEAEEIETALEEAFEAGIAAVFGEEYKDDELDENDEEKALRRLLIAGLINRRPLRRRRITRRLFVGSLIRSRVRKRQQRE
jgi:hypothetical protein